MSSKRKFIDIGANLLDPMYKGFYNHKQIPNHPPDIDKVLTRAFNSCLSKIIITGTSLESSEKAVEMARTDDRLFATVGVHPTQCSDFCNEDVEEHTQSLKELIRNNSDKVVAYGEFGLDYDRLTFCPKDVQQKYFLHQLDISREFDLPLFLHSRNANEDLLNYLEPRKGTIRGVVHSFDGDLNSMNRIVELGLYIGINGCSLKTEDNLSVITKIPLEKLLIETDSPWCEIKQTSAAYKHVKTKLLAVKKEKWNENSIVKGRNEPSNIMQVFEAIAGIREEDADHIEKQICKNTEDLFFSKK